MSWQKGGSGKGPWGNRPTGGGPSSGGGPSKEPPPPPDFDAWIRRGQESFRTIFGGGKDGKGSSARPLALGALALLAIWFFSGIYHVDAKELGVVLRFGEYNRRAEPGLNYHLPYPIEKVYTPPVTTINREEVGFRSLGRSSSGNDTRQIVPEESLMLTGDKNIVSAQFEVQWRINDPVKFLFKLRNPERMVKPVAETAMREVMGNKPLSLALSDQRQSIAEATRALMQSVLDEYETGIYISDVNLLAVDAPEPVVDAFIDVLSAQQEKETLRNQALRYRDGIIPVAEGQREKMIKDAQGYKEAVVAQAKGDASRFLSVYNEYKQAKDITKKRIYLETMEQILTGMTKIILDDSASRGVLPYLPLPAIEKNKPDTRGGAAQ